LKPAHDLLQQLPDTRDVTGKDPTVDKVKIAIIDNGVDQIRSTISDKIYKGESFVEIETAAGIRESPWWIAADPHGTQMASLILEANPDCLLYIGKAGRYRNDLRLNNIVKVKFEFD
jgi:hypothetical protein